MLYIAIGFLLYQLPISGIFSLIGLVLIYTSSKKMTLLNENVEGLIWVVFIYEGLCLIAAEMPVDVFGMIMSLIPVPYLGYIIDFILAIGLKYYFIYDWLTLYAEFMQLKKVQWYLRGSWFAMGVCDILATTVSNIPQISTPAYICFPVTIIIFSVLLGISNRLE